MNNDTITQLLMSLNDKVTEEKMPILKQRLEQADEDKLTDISCLNLYNPTHILLFAIFLGSFGVDRFMIGDVGLGIAKLLLGWLTCGIWPLIDIFMSYKSAKEKNFNKIMSIL